MKISSNFLYLFFIAIFILIDQIIKFLSLTFLKPVHSFQIIKNFFYLTYVENRGAAFGIFSGARYLFIIFTIFITIFLFKFLLFNSHTLFTKISLIFIISGAIGNLIDRIFRGFVVDMFDFIFFGYNFAVFNFADILVVFGTFLLSIKILQHK